MINLSTFRNSFNPNNPPTPYPGGRQVLFYISGSQGQEKVTAMNVSVLDGNGRNTFDSLNNLTSLTITLLGVNTKLLPTTKKFYNSDDGDYFSYTVEPVDISSRISPSTPTGINDTYDDFQTFLVPTPADSDFFRSEYQAILNNTEEDRVTNFIYDVDRSNSSIVPLNYNNIISGSAQKAAFQKLNHTSIGLRNSRYDGAKTSKASFGVSPAIAGTTFEAASYLSSSLNSTICSQSLSDRNLDTFVFTGTDEVPLSGSSIFKFNNNQIVPVRNRRLWVRENEKVIYVNQQGEATSDGFSCIV